MNQVILSGIAKDLNHGVSQGGVDYCRFTLMVEDKRAGSIPITCVVLKECANTLNEAGEGSEVLFIGQVAVKSRTVEATGKTYNDQSISGFELKVIKSGSSQAEQQAPDDDGINLENIELNLDQIPF